MTQVCSKDILFDTQCSQKVHQQAFVDTIRQKFSQIVVTEPQRNLFPGDFLLSRQINRPHSPNMERIPSRTKISGMIAEIINEQACKQLRRIYKRITSGKVKEKYEPKKIPKGSVFADPKALKSNLDGNSKTRRSYCKAYSAALEKTTSQLGEAKPLETKRRVQNIRTTTTDFKQYPQSPRLTESTILPNTRKSKLRPRSKAFSVQKQYQSTFILDDSSPLDQYLNNIHLLRKKRSMVYNTRRQDIESITRLAKEQGLDNIDFYEKIIIGAKRRRNTQA